MADDAEPLIALAQGVWGTRIDPALATEGAAHRGGRFGLLHLPFRDDGQGHHLWWSLGTLQDGYESPRHRHNFDQVRYMVEGHTVYEGMTLQEGDCAYFPESVPYGPQVQRGGDGVVLTLQLPGASKQYYPLPQEVKEATARLREEDPSFGRGGRGRNARGEAVDAFEAIWERVVGARMVYAAPGSPKVAVMRRNDMWPAQMKHPFVAVPRGRFEPHGLSVLSIYANGGSVLGCDPSHRGELWFLRRGSATIATHVFDAFSAFQLQPGARPLEMTTTPGTEFFVVRLPRR